jgi:predicted nucleic acid-binding protein
LIFVDTNVLVDVASGDPDWVDWSIEALYAARRTHDKLIINAIVYSEFSIGFAEIGECDAALGDMDVELIDIPREAAFRAGEAFHAYRRRGGARTSALPDFFIGAHASVSGAPILTRDVRRYRTYFPEVALFSP